MLNEDAAVKPSRRRFLKMFGAGAGTALAGAVAWGGFSEQRAARWLRRMIKDSGRAIQPAPVHPTPLEWLNNRITLCWIGHATVLINFYGFHILTDPAFGKRVGIPLGIGTAGPKRFIAPALRLRELPTIDLVVLSHAHMDHMDLPTLQAMDRGVPVVTADLTSDLVRVAGRRRITELRWGDRIDCRSRGGDLDLEVEAIEVKHWGERWPSKLERGYNGYILRREGKALLFAGDTADTPLFANLRSRGPFEAAILPIGAYDPWIWNHCTPEQAVGLAIAAGARYIVPVHHQTYRLSNEPMREPIERFEQALATEPDRIALRQIGETFVCPPD